MTMPDNVKWQDAFLDAQTLASRDYAAFQLCDGGCPRLRIKKVSREWKGMIRGAGSITPVRA